VAHDDIFTLELYWQDSVFHRAICRQAENVCQHINHVISFFISNFIHRLFLAYQQSTEYEENVNKNHETM